jgi:hypothetical protein
MRRDSKAEASAIRFPVTRRMPAPAVNCASSIIGALGPPRTKRGDSDGSPSPRSTRFPLSVPEPSTVPSRSTSVLNTCSAPSFSSAMAAVNSFIVLAGTSLSSAPRAKRVSPRVMETTIAPQAPLRVRLPSSAARSAVSAVAPRGVV